MKNYRHYSKVSLFLREASRVLVSGGCLGGGVVVPVVLVLLCLLFLLVVLLSGTQPTGICIWLCGTLWGRGRDHWNLDDGRSQRQVQGYEWGRALGASYEEYSTNDSIGGVDTAICFTFHAFCLGCHLFWLIVCFVSCQPPLPCLPQSPARTFCNCCNCIRHGFGHEKV